MIAELHSRGYMIEGATKMKLSVTGIHTRVLARFKPKESLSSSWRLNAGEVLRDLGEAHTKGLRDEYGVGKVL